MGQMPRGEPRSVPDPVGDQYNEMIRRERLKRQFAESIGNDPSAWNEDVADSLSRRYDFSPKPSNQLSSRSGAAFDPRCVVQPDPSAVSPEELAEQKRAIQRAFFMTDHPLAGAAYGIASLISASQGTRDTAMLAGGAADTLMAGAAPQGAPIGRRPSLPKAEVAPPPLLRPNIRIREQNASGQATGQNSTVTPAMLGRGRRPARWIKPTGWSGNGTLYNEARGHLAAGQFGGPHDEPANFVTLTQNRANSPYMRDFENAVARRVRGGEIMEYSATPLYNAPDKPPAWMFLTAYGPNGPPMARVIQNPAGWR